MLHTLYFFGKNSSSAPRLKYLSWAQLCSEARPTAHGHLYLSPVPTPKVAQARREKDHSCPDLTLTQKVVSHFLVSWFEPFDIWVVERGVEGR